MSRNIQSGRIEELCLVITADCDISKGKFGRQLVSLRVISFRDYIATVWADKKLRKMEADEAEKLRAQIAKWHTRTLGFESSLTTEAAVAWALKVNPDEIAAELTVPDEDRKKFVSALSGFRAARDARQTEAERGRLREYVAFRSAALRIDREKCRQQVFQSANKEDLPEDIFLLPNLPQLDFGASAVLLRELVSVPYEAVCYRASDVLSSAAFLRIGRLQATFKYAISQAFGALYSRIGLPDAYERRCKTALEQTDYGPWE